MIWEKDASENKITIIWLTNGMESMVVICQKVKKKILNNPSLELENLSPRENRMVSLLYFTLSALYAEFLPIIIHFRKVLSLRGKTVCIGHFKK